MNSKDYWAKRARADKIKVIKTGEKGIDNLKRLLKTNLDNVEHKIKAFYDKYGDNPAEKLSYQEFEKYKKDLAKKAKQFPKDKTLQKLAKEDIPKYKIDRLRALQTELQIQLAEATAGQEKGIYKTLNDVGKVSQATLAKTFKKTIGLEFNTLASHKMKQLLSSDWSGMNWSERLWKDRELVGKKVTEILEKGIPQGTSLQTMSRELKNATGTSFNDAFRLIRTETSHIDGQVTLEGYKQAKEELGLEYYEYDAFLDTRTSAICEELNGKRFRIDEAQVGVNYPPMHPNCRSTTQLVLDENYKKEEKRESDSSDLSKFMKDEIKDVKGQKAIETLIEKQNGYVENAFVRSDIGSIDLLWGNDEMGLKHIIKRRKEQNINIEEFLSNITEVIEKGDLIRINEKGRYEIFLNKKKVIVEPKSINGKSTFLLTAFKARKP